MTCDKATFRNIADAKKTAQGMSIAKGLSIRPYLCPVCGCYHLTTKNRRNYLQRNQRHAEPVKLKLKDLGGRRNILPFKPLVEPKLFYHLKIEL